MSTAQGSNAKAVMPEDEKTGDGAYWEDMWNPVPGEKRLAPGEVRVVFYKVVSIELPYD
jgi:hypothetical protein